MRILLIFSSILLALSTGFAQTDKALLRDLAKENRKSIEALALYPEDARVAILEASKYPEVLIKMQGIREKTAAAFRTLIEDYPRNTQDVFYDLTRFPGLVPDLVARQNNRQSIQQALEVLPENKRADALAIAERNPGTLAKINDLNQTAQRAYDNLIAMYPAPAQAAFRTLLGLPEVVDILNEDLRFTIMVGDVYREDPAWVIRKMDSLHLAVARAHADEQAEWKQTLANDPQAQQELQSAAQEYAREYGYVDEIYDIMPNDDLYAEPAPTTQVVNHYYYDYAYPYWFGYPWWAPQPCWRPYPYWWYWGFYPYGRVIVVVHMPSYHFMHWFFHHPYHHYRHNRLSTHFVGHYNRHRNSGTTITAGVNEWRNENRGLVSDDWLRDQSRLPERLREYGRFEQERQTFNDKNPGKALTREQFLDKNTKRFPELTQSRATAKTEIQRERVDETQRRSDWAPQKEPVKPDVAPSARIPRTEAPDRPKTQPVTPPRTQPTDKTQPPVRQQPQTRQPVQKPPIDDAKDYHRDKWQEPKQKPQTQPAPRKETPKQVAPARKERGG
ncbi:MAG: hypothetical protein JNJ90_13025 [Saprospiraceae bacterium]|nr:hypothetical protein [Saprospiraceae bacterium]